jgi:beta-N-acetylhexosaminidase
MSTPARKVRSPGRVGPRFFGLCLHISLVIAGCAPFVRAPRAESRDVLSGMADPRADAWVDSVLRSLGPRDRAAQMVWPQLLGDYAPDGTPGWDRVSRLIATEHVGGFVMSVGSPLETAAKLNAMQRLSTVPLIIGADYEAGAGFRSRGGYFLPNGIDLGGATLFPPQMALGAAGDTALAYDQGRITAIEGRALGVHVNFGPVLDVNSNPNNPVIGARAFGEEPEMIGALGASMIRGLQSNGMFATGKHFPGHGDTDQNSHLSVTMVNATRERLDSVDFVPFRRAIAAGVSSIMTFHGVIPALDTTPVPATLSPVVMRGLLRGQFAFDGLLITDALDMNGVLARVRPSATGATTVTGVYGTIDSPGLAEVVKLAVQAGNDILLMPLDVPTAIDAVVAGVREGRFSQARVDSSVRRTLRHKYAMGLDRNRYVDLDVARKIVGSGPNLAAADRIAERSITLPIDSLGIVPLQISPRPRVLSVTMSARADLGAGTAFDTELRRAADVRSVWVDAADPASGMSRALGLADSVGTVVIGSYLSQGTTVADPNAAVAFVEFVRGVTHANRRTIVVAFGNPYFFQQIPFVPAYMIAWGGFSVSQRAAARSMLGERAITGRLPISIPPALRLGDGLRRDARVSP